MGSLRIVDVLRLVAADDESADYLKKLFEWQIDRAMTTVRTMTAAVIALVAALIAGILSNEHISTGLVAGVVASAAVAFGYSRSQYDAAVELEGEYLVALNVLRELRPLAPLIRLSPDLYVD